MSIDKKTLAVAKSYTDKISENAGSKLTLVENGEGNAVVDIEITDTSLIVTKDNVESKEIWMGTVAELEALTEEEKAKYTIFITTDEEGKVVTDLEIVDDGEGTFITGLTLNEQNELVVTRANAQHPEVTVLADSEKTADLAHGDTQTVVTGILTDEDGHLCQVEKTTFTLPNETELTIEETGTGNTVSNISVENHKITVMKQNRVEKDIAVTQVGEGEFITGITATNHDITATRGNVTLDGKVKMDADSSSQYLTQLLDGVTIENQGGYLVVKSLQNLTVGASELNCLLGVNFNIAERFNNLTNPLTFLGVVDTYADLEGLTPENGNVVIVRNDEMNNSSQMTYIYSTEWNEVSENEIELRNFTLNPLDLEKETTGILPISKVDVSTLATKADIEGMLTSETPVTVTESGTGSFVTGVIAEDHELTVVKSDTHFVYGVSDLINAPTNTMFQWQGETTETLEKGQFYVKDESDNVTKVTDFATKGEIPTKTSELENNSCFVTSAELPSKISELENDKGYLTTETTLSISTSGDGNVISNIEVDNHQITVTKTTISSGSGVTIEQSQNPDSNYNFGSKVELVTEVTQSEDGTVTVTKTPMNLMDLTVSEVGEGEFVKSIQVTNDTDDSTGAGIRVLEITKGDGSTGGGVGKKVYREETSTDEYKISTDWIDTYLTFKGSSDYGEVFNSGSETIGISATATGLDCQALAPCSFAEGRKTIAHGVASHASGYGCEAGNTLWSYQNIGSIDSNASMTAVADGYFTKAYGKYSGSHGFKTCAYGDASVAFGKETEATRNYSAVFGLGTSDLGLGESGFVIGKYNELTSSNAIFVIGGGSSTSNRKNLLAVDLSGNIFVAGNGAFTNSVTGAAGYFGESLQAKSIEKRVYSEDGTYTTVPVAYVGDCFTIAQSDGRYVKIADMSNFNGAIGATSGYFGESLQAKSIEKRVYNENGTSYHTVSVLYDGDCYTVTQADNTFIKKTDLTNPTQFLGVVDTYAGLAGVTPENGSVVIVKEDETNNGKRISYIYTSSGWTVLGEESVKLRDFVAEPINLSTEVTGTLKQANMDLEGYARTEDLADYAKTERVEAVAQDVADLVENTPIKAKGITLTFTDGTATYENANIHADSLISIFWDDPTCGIEVSNVEEGKITFTCDEVPSNTTFSVVIM